MAVGTPLDAADGGDPSQPLADVAVAWFDLENPSYEELDWLRTAFRFHPLAVEDCTHFDQRSKIEEYSDHLFIVIHGMEAGGAAAIQVYELHCFLAAGVVVTVHDGPIRALTELKDRMRRDREQLPRDEAMA